MVRAPSHAAATPAWLPLCVLLAALGLQACSTPMPAWEPAPVSPQPSAPQPAAPTAEPPALLPPVDQPVPAAPVESAGVAARFADAAGDHGRNGATRNADLQAQLRVLVRDGQARVRLLASQLAARCADRSAAVFSQCQTARPHRPTVR